MALNEFPYYTDGGEQINEDESAHSQPAREFKDQENPSHRKENIFLPRVNSFLNIVFFPLYRGVGRFCRPHLDVHVRVCAMWLFLGNNGRKY